MLFKDVHSCDLTSSFPRDNLSSESTTKCLLYAKTLDLFGSCLVPKPLPPSFSLPLGARLGAEFSTDENLVVAVKDNIVCVCSSLLGWDGTLSSALRAAVLVFCLSFSIGTAKVKAVFSQREIASSKMSKTTAAGIPYENKHTYQR